MSELAMSAGEMPVRTGREERGYGHTDGGARADGVSGMAA